MLNLEGKTTLMKFFGSLINCSLLGLVSMIGLVVIMNDLSHYSNWPLNPYMFLAAHFIVCFFGGPPLVLFWLTGSKALGFAEAVNMVAKEDPFLEVITMLVVSLSVQFYASGFLYTILNVREGRKNKVD
jgi:hypothetical protein